MIPVGKVLVEFVPPRVSAKGRYHDGQRVGKDFGKVFFLRKIQMKCEALLRRAELGVYPRFIAPAIHSIPAEFGQIYGIQAMQRIWRTLVINAEALIAKSRRNAICPKEGSQKMAFRIAVTRAIGQNLGSGTRDRVPLVVGTMLNIVAYPFVAAARDLQFAGSAFCQSRSFRLHRRYTPIDYFGGLQKSFHHGIILSER